MRSQLRYLLMILISIIFTFPSLSFAQEDEGTLILRVNRDFGYGGGSRIQGRFSMRATGPEDLVRVEFLVDSEIVNEDREAPFRYTFSTNDFSPGVHTLSALGYTSGGAVLSSVTFTYEFLTSEEARSDTVKLVIPLLAVIAAFSFIALLGPVILGRGKSTFRIGEYGLAGGAVCPRCTFPYSRHALSPNLFFGKLERCPHCRKWAVVGRASPVDLEAAEIRLQDDYERGRRPIDREEDQDLKRLLEESRFED